MLPSVVISKMIQNSAEKQFFTCKHNRKTLAKVIPISQSSIDTITKLGLIGKIMLYVIC